MPACGLHERDRASLQEDVPVISKKCPPSRQELDIEMGGGSGILVVASKSEVGVTDVTEECTVDFHLIWLEMMAEQPNIRMFGTFRCRFLVSRFLTGDDCYVRPHKADLVLLIRWSVGLGSVSWFRLEAGSGLILITIRTF